MANITIDVTGKTSQINLGIQGENIVENVIFDVSKWITEYGDGVAYIYAKRKGDTEPYPVALTMDLDAGTATWEVTAVDTAYKGKGFAQLIFVSDDDAVDAEVYSSSETYEIGEYCIYGSQLYVCTTAIETAEAWNSSHWQAVDEVKKTKVYKTTVQASITATSTESPSAYDTWLETLGGFTARIEEAYVDTEAAKDAAEDARDDAQTAKTGAETAESGSEAQALKAEGYAVGTQNGTDVTEGTYYHNNAKYYSEQASSSATTASNQATAAAGSANAASGSAEDSEAYAIGKRDGVDVTSGDAAYQNNSKYYATQASGSATTATLKASAASDSASTALGYSRDAEAWADGTRNGTDVDSDDPAYHNSSKYWKEQTESSASAASSSASAASASALVSEGYAKGTQNGTDVDSSSTYYHNNAKYYSDHADEAAKAQAQNAEAWAKGTKNGTPVSSGTDGYHDNAKYYKELADTDATNANTNALKAEGYAIGEQGGTAVESGTYYHNNAKYYSDQASTSATNAGTSETNASGSASTASTKALVSEGFAVGEQGGAEVESGSPYYENNSKYYAEQAADSATAAAESAASLTVDSAMSDSSTNPVQNKVINAEIESIHDDIEEIPSGTYPDMTVGGLMGDGPTDQVPYNFRPSGGGVKVGDREVDKIVGGSLVWNQLVQNGNFSNGNTGWNINGTYSISNGVVTWETPSYYANLYQSDVNIAIGHKYLVLADINSTAQTTCNFDGKSVWSYKQTDGVWKTLGGIVSATGVSGENRFRLMCVQDNVSTNILIKNAMIFDLTAMFGSTIADYIYSLEQATSGAGVAWFRKLFPEDYYAYNAGTIQSVKTSAHIMRDADNNVIGNYALDNTLELRGIPKLDSNNQLYFDGDTYESDGTVTRNTILRAYQSGDESLANAITDGTNTVVYSANASTEQADPYTNPQIVDDWGTEEYTDYAYEAGDRDVAIPVGHVTLYPANLRKKIEGLPWDLSMIAPIENGTKASKAYSAGQYFLKDEQFCKALTSIASGATFTLNTNYAVTTVAAEIYTAINS